MAENEPSKATVKRLFAMSGNRCAFPKCTTPIVENTGTVSGIICHIRARSPGGPRFDAEQLAEQRHGFDNLILMCARHSKVIDTEVQKYSVERLVRMKRVRERSGAETLPERDSANALRLLKGLKRKELADFRMTIREAAFEWEHYIELAQRLATEGKAVEGKQAMLQSAHALNKIVAAYRFNKHLFDSNSTMNIDLLLTQAEGSTEADNSLLHLVTAIQLINFTAESMADD